MRLILSLLLSCALVLGPQASANPLGPGRALDALCGANIAIACQLGELTATALGLYDTIYGNFLEVGRLMENRTLQLDFSRIAPHLPIDELNTVLAPVTGALESIGNGVEPVGEQIADYQDKLKEAVVNFEGDALERFTVAAQRSEKGTASRAYEENVDRFPQLGIQQKVQINRTGDKIEKSGQLDVGAKLSTELARGVAEDTSAADIAAEVLKTKESPLGSPGIAQKHVENAAKSPSSRKVQQITVELLAESLEVETGLLASINNRLTILSQQEALSNQAQNLIGAQLYEEGMREIEEELAAAEGVFNTAYEDTLAETGVIKESLEKLEEYDALNYTLFKSGSMGW